jgi:hypothetical protein
MVKLSVFSFLVGAGSVLAGVRPPRYFADIQRRAALDRRAAAVESGLEKRADAATISFANPKTNDFLVDGTKIPEVEFDVGPSWSGEYLLQWLPSEKHY